MELARYHIDGLKLHAYIGVFDFEQKDGNEFSIDISYSAPYKIAADSDELSDAVNYADICRIVEETFSMKCNLLEQIAQLTVTSLKNNFPQIQDLSVTVTKLNPPVSQNVKGISITVNG